MNTDEVVAQLKTERDRLDKAIAVLTESGRGKGRGKKRRMSTAGRKRISMAQKKRWALIKKKTT
jgi:hypothetical protein